MIYVLEIRLINKRALFWWLQCKKVVEAYCKETEWYAQDYVPTFEEHLQISLVSTAYPMLICASFVGMDNVATRAAFEWVTGMPEVVKASAVICRLMDDITSSEVMSLSFDPFSQSIAPDRSLYISLSLSKIVATETP